MCHCDLKCRDELAGNVCSMKVVYILTCSSLNQDTNQCCGVRNYHTHINFVLWSVSRKYSTHEPHTEHHAVYKVFMAYHLHLLENLDLRCHGKGTV